MAAAGFLAVGCGDDEEPEQSKPEERADELPKLPPGWTVHRNQNAGVAFGVPPAWSAENEGNVATVKSPEQLVAMTILADRTDDVLEVDLEQQASATVAAIDEVQDLEPGETREYGHRYEAVAIKATGVAGKEEIKQDFLLVLVRREDLALFTVLVARNAKRDTSAYDDDIGRMIASIRSRPPG